MDDGGDKLFSVLVNEEGQYSIWPQSLAVPSGWAVEGDPQLREECLRYIDRVWTDMRPASLRRLATRGQSS